MFDLGFFRFGGLISCFFFPGLHVYLRMVGTTFMSRSRVNETYIRGGGQASARYLPYALYKKNKKISIPESRE